MSTAPRWSDLTACSANVSERIAHVDDSDHRLEFGRSYCRPRNLRVQPGQSPLDTFELYHLERTGVRLVKTKRQGAHDLVTRVLTVKGKARSGEPLGP